MTRARATADTQDNNGGSVPPHVGAKNKILNADFSIWQRGTSFNVTGGTTYTADRMINYYNSSPTVTVSRQSFTPGELPAATSPFYYRFAQTTAGSGMTYSSVCGQFVEDVRTLQGTVTFSFYAKSSISSTQLAVGIFQVFGTGGSSINYQYAPGTVALTTSWQRYSVTITLDSLSGKTIGANSCLQPSIEFGASSRNVVQTVDIWGLQLEAGSVATPFTTATGTLQGELSACQRYYQRLTANNAYGWFPAWAGTTSTTAFQLTYPLITQMRVGPTSLEYGGNLWLKSATDAGFAISSLTYAGVTTPTSGAASGVVASTTSGAYYRLQANNDATAYVAWSAEL